MVTHFYAVLLLSCLSSALASVTPYPAVLGDQANPQYSVTVNGVHVDATTTVMKVGYAHFAFDGKVRVEIRAIEPIVTYDLSPHRLGIDVNVKGNALSFELNKPSKLHLRINNLERFFLFAEGQETNRPDSKDEGVLLLTDCGIVSSETVVQTNKIQQALETAVATRRTLYVPAGIYLLGTLHLPSDLKLYLAPGAIIKGTAKLADYETGPGGLAQLQVLDGSNIHIFGRGVIDNNGLALRSQFLPDRNRGRCKMLVANKSRNLLIEDIILRDSAVWCIHAMQSKDMHFSNLKIISIARSETGPSTSHNTDAFDPDNSSNIVMENNFISVDDDAIAVKLKGGKRASMSNITFRDNVVWNVCSALKIGTEVHDHTIRDVLFENNDIVHTDTGIVVQCYRGGYVDGVNWINNYFEQVGVVSNHSPHRKGSNIYINSRSEDSFGEIRNLLIKDNTFERFSDVPSMIRAAGPTQVVDTVVFDNLVIANKKCDSAIAARVKVDHDAKNVDFK